jgi:hypothetical protein
MRIRIGSSLSFLGRKQRQYLRNIDNTVHNPKVQRYKENNQLKLNFFFLDTVCWGQHMYEVHSETNASYFIIVAYDDRGECWWYGSRGWTFPPIVCMLCCRAIDSSTEAVWQNGVWYGSAYEAEVCYWIPPCGKKLHPLTFIDVYGDQTVDVSTVRRWVVRFSSVDSDVKDKPRSGRACKAARPWHEELNVGLGALRRTGILVYQAQKKKVPVDG